MKDKDFLQWLHGRLLYIHKENVNVDYMLKLQAIINDLDENITTPNSVPSSINMVDHTTMNLENIFGYMSEKKNIPIDDNIQSDHRRKFNLRDLPNPPTPPKKRTINEDVFFKNSI